MKKINLITSLHLATKRNYLERMINQKVECMNEAKKYEKNYWDGKRKYGYGGYKYIPGRWTPVARKLIRKYNLNNNSKILDIGCGKGFLIYEIKKILPKIHITGFDISNHAKSKSSKLIRNCIRIKKAQSNYNYNNNFFDLAISLGCFHNLELFDLKKAVSEMMRISKKQYLMVESYRNNKELFNLQCWALTCETFFSKKEWTWFLEDMKFKGDYELIYFL